MKTSRREARGGIHMEAVPMTQTEKNAVKTLLDALKAAGITDPARWIDEQRKALKNGGR